jgi:hypothetical protein
MPEDDIRDTSARTPRVEAACVAVEKRWFSTERAAQLFRVTVAEVELELERRKAAA